MYLILWKRYLLLEKQMETELKVINEMLIHLFNIIHLYSNIQSNTIKTCEVKIIISKAPGYNLINRDAIKELPNIAIKYFASHLNS